jgi:hypothetical protein
VIRAPGCGCGCGCGYGRSDPQGMPLTDNVPWGTPWHAANRHCPLGPAPAPVILSHPSLSWVYRRVSGHKILAANHVLRMQQINPSHHLMSVVYVYPRRLAGSSEGHWLSALRRCTKIDHTTRATKSMRARAPRARASTAGPASGVAVRRKCSFRKASLLSCRSNPATRRN